MTPRRIRDEIREGRIVLAGKKAPDPPQEWKPWRQKRMTIAIRAAWSFLGLNMDIREINAYLVEDRFIDHGLTKSRIAQYVSRGVKFFEQRGLLVPMKIATPKSDAPKSDAPKVATPRASVPKRSGTNGRKRP